MERTSRLVSWQTLRSPPVTSSSSLLRNANARATRPQATPICGRVVRLFAQPGFRGGRMDAPDTKSLPENAYRPLTEGEAYRPIIPPAAVQEEASVRSIAWGLFLCVIFTIASAYSGLK